MISKRGSGRFSALVVMMHLQAFSLLQEVLKIPRNEVRAISGSMFFIGSKFISSGIMKLIVFNGCVEKFGRAHFFQVSLIFSILCFCVQLNAKFSVFEFWLIKAQIYIFCFAIHKKLSFCSSLIRFVFSINVFVPVSKFAKWQDRGSRESGSYRLLFRTVDEGLGVLDPL